MDEATTSYETTPGAPSFADRVARLSQFDGPPGQFLARLLEVQCDVAPAEGGAIVGVAGEQSVRVLVIHPPLEPDTAAPLWLAQSAEAVPRVAASGTIDVVPLNGAAALGNGTTRHLVLIPLRGAQDSQAVAVYVVHVEQPIELDLARERLELTIGLLSLYEIRIAMQAPRASLDRLRDAMEVLDAANAHGRHKAAAMAFCNEVAARWNAHRVALGFLHGRYVKTAAISHTEKFDRKMKLVQDLESAMEESLDQDVEILHPAAPEATFVHRSAGQLSLRHGPASVVSLPLRRDGEPIGVVTVERGVEEPYTADEIETLRLTCDLSTARLADLHANDRWIGAKVAAASRRGFGHLVGPRHTWAKMTALAVLAAILFLVFARGSDRVEASFMVDAVERRFVPAPFDARLQQVAVEPGDPAEAGVTVLATLETAEMQMQLAAARAEYAGYVKQADLALRDGETVEVQIAEANLQRVEAEIHLLEHQIAQATIVAPIDGTVVTGDLKRRIGAPVQTGDVLFEIAPLESLRAELEVPEDRISDLFEVLDEGARGSLASVAHPGDYIEFEVERVNPVAEVIDQQNVFRVRVRLLGTRPWLRPGMKGVAKVDVGRRSYAYLWTRAAVNWVRMKLWI